MLHECTPLQHRSVLYLILWYLILSGVNVLNWLRANAPEPQQHRAHVQTIINNMKHCDFGISSSTFQSEQSFFKKKKNILTIRDNNFSVHLPYLAVCSSASWQLKGGKKGNMPSPRGAFSEVVVVALCCCFFLSSSYQSILSLF